MKDTHFAGVCFPTSVDFTEASAANNSMYAEVVHRQLKQQQTQSVLDSTFYTAATDINDETDFVNREYYLCH